MIVELQTSRLLLTQTSYAIVPSIISYLAQNRAFHAPYEPIRPNSYYSIESWEKKAETAQNDLEEGKLLELFISQKSKPEQIIGKIGFSGMVRAAFQACYLGYAMGEKKQGNGFMTEALAESIKFMFENQNFHRIMANYMIENLASEAVLKKLGFDIEGTAKDYLYISGKWEDHILTSLTNQNWKPPVS